MGWERPRSEFLERGVILRLQLFLKMERVDDSREASVEEITKACGPEKAWQAPGDPKNSDEELGIKKGDLRRIDLVGTVHSRLVHAEEPIAREDRLLNT